MTVAMKITAYLTDLSSYREFSRVRAEIFPDDVPSSSTVVSPALIMPGLLVEIEAMAIIGSGD